jgi:DNA primase
VFDRQVNEINDFTDPSLNDVINVSASSNMKGLMSKMISCVINYPSSITPEDSSGVIEERAKRLPKSDVLMELIHSAQIEPDITKEALIKPYENKNMVFSRLNKLSVMEPFLSENEAKIEFMSTLTAAENHQQRKSTKASILSAKTKAEEKKIADDIIRRKMSSGYKKNP